jgi:hypothetical protein
MRMLHRFRRVRQDESPAGSVTRQLFSIPTPNNEELKTSLLRLHLHIFCPQTHTPACIIVVTGLYSYDAQFCYQLKTDFL